jgi:prophage regulatory protein
MGRMIRLAEVLSVAGCSEATLWRWERAGLFPRRRRIGLRAVAWDSEEVEEWRRTRPLCSTATVGEVGEVRGAL